MPILRKLLPVPLLLLLACTACNRENPMILPSKLDGFWTTDDPRDQDRFLELNGTYLVVGVSRRGIPNVQFVDKFKTVYADQDTTYTIFSTDLQGMSYQISLQFNPANGGEIRLKNQLGTVWKRHG
jgi:hypothetical protein